MKYIDMHCDTLSKGIALHKDNIINFSEASIDIDRLVGIGAYAQFFAVFMAQNAKPSWYGFDDSKPLPDHWVLFEEMHKLFMRTLNADDRIAFSGNYSDLKANEEAGKVSAFLTVENGYLVNGQMENLKKLHDNGVRLITLTWNDPNYFGQNNTYDPSLMDLGLTEFGIEAIFEMNRLGIIIDVSHLNDGGFWDVIKHSNKPFVASHSNSRLLSPHQRNLTDEMIKALADKGGISGLNFNGPFLNADINDEHSSIEAMVRHIKHFINVGGEDFVALGTDFDGIGGQLEIEGCHKMGLLFDALSVSGIPDSIIEKIAYKNVERIIKECL